MPSPPASPSPASDGGLTVITGATGFVGSHIADAYARNGGRVRCTARASSDLRWLEGIDAEPVECDLRETEGFADAVRGADRVVHAAGITRAPDPATFHQVNAEGTVRMARAAREAGVRRFVFISSLAARGPDDGEPGRPGRRRPDDPVSDYGRSKLAAEEALRGFEEEMEVVVLRPGGVYGPRDRDLLSLFQMASHGRLLVPAAENLLQPVYVEDVARATLRAGGGSPGFGPWPIAERGRYGWNAVAEAFEGALERELHVHHVPPRLFLVAAALLEKAARVAGRAPPFDRRRARDLAQHQWTCETGPTERALGWEPSVPLPEGLRRTVAWYRERGWI